MPMCVNFISVPTYLRCNGNSITTRARTSENVRFITCVWESQHKNPKTSCMNEEWWDEYKKQQKIDEE